MDAKKILRPLLPTPTWGMLVETDEEPADTVCKTLTFMIMCECRGVKQDTRVELIFFAAVRTTCVVVFVLKLLTSANIKLH
jgi:hypothetical protein